MDMYVCVCTHACVYTCNCGPAAPRTTLICIGKSGSLIGCRTAAAAAEGRWEPDRDRRLRRFRRTDRLLTFYA